MLVDTGANVTSLHPTDCQGIAYDLLGLTSETTGIGGISEYYKEPALVTFRDIIEDCAKSCSTEYEPPSGTRMLKLLPPFSLFFIEP